MVKSKKTEVKKIKKNFSLPSQITEKKFDSVKIIESKELVNAKIIESENRINNQKFLEFLSISTQPIETLASKKPRNGRPIEQDQEVLSMNIQKEENEFEKKDFTSSAPKDYNFFSSREERKQEIFSKPIEPTRVNFVDIGRDFRIFQREFLEREPLPFSSEEIGKTKDYVLERVDFTEVGREKRYKLMK